MASYIGRRTFLAALGGAAVWPLAVRAQQTAMPVVGYLDGGAPETSSHLLAAFRKGLREVGYVEGRNVAIEFRWANSDYDRLPELATDLARRRVSAIVAMGNTPAIHAAQAATTTIPILFGYGGDPIQSGFVASLNRPGGNITGAVTMNSELGAKRLEVLHELLPAASRFAVLVNPSNPIAALLIKDARGAAEAMGRVIEVFGASNRGEINVAFASLVQKRADAVLIAPEALFQNRRVQVLTLAARYTVPTIYPSREFVEAGGLISYGSSFTDLHRQVGNYTGRVLNGEKPADLPVLRPTKFELIINLQSAEALDIAVPSSLLARADEVIE
jgi:putative tryptophan/tyrosine transport system substrate-binding protein